MNAFDFKWRWRSAPCSGGPRPGRLRSLLSGGSWSCWRRRSRCWLHRSACCWRCCPDDRGTSAKVLQHWCGLWYICPLPVTTERVNTCLRLLAIRDKWTDAVLTLMRTVMSSKSPPLHLSNGSRSCRRLLWGFTSTLRPTPSAGGCW